MLGAIAGDVIGSVFEHHNTRSLDFELFERRSFFTDDTVLTVAVAHHLLHGGGYAQVFKSYARRFPYAGWGGNFSRWMRSDDLAPYGSYGNGSAMRVSPTGFAFDTLEETLDEARRSAEATHNHPEGVRGAQAVAAAIFLARSGASRQEIRGEVRRRFGYPLELSLEQIRPAYHFDETCQGSVPEAITAFLESTSFEDAVRRAVWLGGDSDTIACIAGGIAQAFYGGVPPQIAAETLKRLPEDFRQTIAEFEGRFAACAPRGEKGSAAHGHACEPSA